MSDIDDIIGAGMVFRGTSKPKTDGGKVRAKVKKEKYITGIHGSGNTKRKVKYHQ